MHCLELLLQKHSNNPTKSSQIHALLITTGFFQLPTPPPNPKSTHTFIYNCLIKCCHPNTALHLFTQMLTHQTQPNHHTFPSLLKSLPFPTLHSIHSQTIRRGLNLHPFTSSSLVDSYARFGLLSHARKAFDETPHPDLPSFNSMLHAFCTNGDLPSALHLFGTMPKRDVISWTTVINGLSTNDQPRRALEMFRRLMNTNSQEGKPNEATLVSVLSACADSALWLGMEVHAYVIRWCDNQLTPFLGTALIDFYGKHGFLNSSAILFKSMERKEVCTWNAMVSALAGNGKELEAMQLFDEMRADTQLRPNSVTLVAALTACSRGQLVDRGLSLFEAMSSEFGVVPRMEHYGCIVDLLSRAGMLKEAREFIRRMPVEADGSVWGALLGACRVHKNAMLGVDVGRKVRELQPWHSGRYVVLSNIFAEEGRWDVAEGLREEMEKAGVKKIVGCSWLDSGMSRV